MRALVDERPGREAEDDLPQPSAVGEPAGDVGVRRSLVLPGAAIVLGLAVAVLVVRDGSPGWQVARLAVTVAVTAAAAIAIGHWPSWAAALTAGALGVVGTAVGAGFGVPYAVKGATLVTSAAGLVALVAGVILLFGGVASLVRMVHGWVRALALLAAVMVVVPLVYAIAVAIAATNVPATTLGAATPADLGLAYRDVVFPATDGVALSGWYIPSANGGAVALLHGAGSTRSAVLDHAAVLAEHGYGVLLFDARGHGHSAGRAMDFGWYGDEDVGGAVSFLAAQPEIEAIAAVGMSMGGEEALGAAAADHRIGAVVAEGATNRVAGDSAWLPDEYGLRGWVQRPVAWLMYAATDVLTAAQPPITLRAAAAVTPSPVLLITAGDVADEFRAARYIASGSARVEVWDVPDTGHTDAIDTHPEEWEVRVTAFLDDALGIAGP